MHGARRVLVFCMLTTVLPIMLLVIPLYLRHSFYANVVYAVTESDILEINDGISTIFCSAHTLQMNGTFNAFQMSHRPEIASYRKHIRLKKSMNLPDDTLEYWGFYLLKGATVALSVCSRFEGASILVVKGERNLRTCGILEHNMNKERAGIFLPDANRQVKITFESNAQEVNSKEESVVLKRKLFATKTITTTPKFTEKEEQEEIPERPRMNEKEIEELYRTADSYVQKHIDEDSKKNGNSRKLRHAKKRLHRVKIEEERKEKEKEKYEKMLKDMLQTETTPYKSQERLKQELNSPVDSEENAGMEKNFVNSAGSMRRNKRNQDIMKSPSLLDQGIQHGGNADRNSTDPDAVSSVSSFENGLFNCYEGSILLAREFEPSDQCVNVSYLLSGRHMQSFHDVTEDGYYYYIFYSDNDFVSNDIHALFDIYKPTFQYENVSKSCINLTECSFSLTMMSADRVIVEIPTRDGIEHESDDISLLTSICHPRMGLYMIFPITVLFLILSCAFM